MVGGSHNSQHGFFNAPFVLTFLSTPLRKLTTRVARLALWLLAIAWITIGLTAAALHFLIVPRIGELRPWLEQQASKELGVTVRIGAIQAQSNGLIPAIEIRDVRLLDQAGREALNIPTVMAALSARSALGLGFEQLHVDGLVLDVRRSADGRIWVAGFPLPKDASADSARADWLFEQTELVVRRGTLHWTDETRKAPTLTLSDVDLVLRNRHRRHDMRLDVTPPSDWGQRFTLQGRFRQPLLSGSKEPWRIWDGQLHADFQAVDLGRLKRYADLGVDLSAGHGALRAWVDVQRGAPVAATADVALRQVSVRAAPELEPLALASMSGRVSAKEVDGGIEYATQGLQFETQEGLRWPGGNVLLRLLPGDARIPPRGELQADQLDLAAMAQIAERVPLAPAARRLLQNTAPRGLVRKIQAQWQGTPQQPLRFTARGRLEQLAIAAQPAPQAGGSGAEPAIGVPGFKGATVDFDMSQAGGRASLSIQSGAVDLPGIFEDPVLPLEQFQSEVQWKIDGAQISVELPRARFANADAQGEAQIQWRTAPLPAGVAPGDAADKRFPGVLELQGNLGRAALARVYRYMPLQLDAEVRSYLRDAVLRGTASGVKFKLKGGLHEFPFTNAAQGEFQVSAKIADADFAYVPASLLHKDSLAWPAVHLVSGDFLIDRGLLQVRTSKASVVGLPGLQISKAQGQVNNLYDEAQLVVNAEARGPLPELLRFVNGSPLGPDILSGALAQATGSGNADYRFKLGFPLAAVERAKVEGTVSLANNELQITPQTPRMTRARAVIGFNETGFTVSNGQVRGLGGDARIEGGMYFGSAAAPAHVPQQLRINGVASAEGLRQAHELGLPSHLAQFVSGSTPYAATIGMRAGSTEVSISSNLVGLASQLPAPFAKAAEASLPLKVEIGAPRAAGATAHQDQLQVEVGRIASIAYVRDVSGTDARVLRGAIGIGLQADESAPLPAEGVIANANLQNVDLDAWSNVLNGLSAAAGGSASGAQALGYLPHIMAVRAKSLVYDGRKLNNVVLGGTRDGLLWRANVDASELSGYAEYRQPSAGSGGRLYARMARLAIAQSTAQDVESLLDEQPTNIPALDIVVENFELRGKKLGQLEIDAVNVGGGSPREPTREWRLNRFNLTTPEASLTASGNWVPTPATPGAGRVNLKDRRRTSFSFKLDIQDSGELLNRFNMPGVLRKGKGKIEGQLGWAGSPITPDYPSMSGSFNVNVESGQFLKTDPGIAKLLGVLSLQSLPRRLALDFRDVFSEGFAFDFLRGDVKIEAGLARTSNLQMKGVAATVLMDGQADIARETQGIKVVVVPEINAGSASVLASLVNPIMGLSTFLAQLIVRSPFIDAITQEYYIDGTWAEPRVTKVDRGARANGPASVPPATASEAKP